MEGGAGYGLEDFLLFAPRTFYRLVEIHHLAIWPSQILTLLAGIVIGLWLWRPRRPAVVPALLAVLWLWVAFAWFYRRYATINWAADYLAALFALEGLLLLAMAWSGGMRIAVGRDRQAGLGLFWAVLAGSPFLAPLAGRSWLQLDLFGATPDPTAMGTLAVLVATRGRGRWIGLPIPLLWCLISGATQLAMDAPLAWVAPLVACGVVLCVLTPARRAEP